jgi:molecular chaperone GrpE
MSDPREAYEQSQALRPDAPESGASDGVGGEAGDEGATSPDAPGEPDGAEATRGAGPATDDAVDRDPAELAAALAEAEAQRDEYLDHLRRERAEFDNFRKRNAKERLEAMDRGIQSLVTELLGVLDNFGHVLAAAEDSPDESLAKGAAMVHEELTGVLSRFGLEDVPGEGSPFDPQWHEAMMRVAADDGIEEPVVAEVLRTGYRFKGRVLRPASVSVAQ